MMFPIGNIVNMESSNMGTFSDRLREERARLALTQDQMAAAAGLNRSAQIRYEKGERNPDADYLAAVAAVGVDIAYVITGVASATMAKDEVELLRRYRSATPEVRAAVLGALGLVAVASGVGVQIGKASQVITGGDVDQSNAQFHISGGKKKRPSKG